MYKIMLNRTDLTGLMIVCLQVVEGGLACSSGVAIPELGTPRHVVLPLLMISSLLLIS